HRRWKADTDCAADNAMADVQFHQVWNPVNEWKILIVQSVAGVDLEAEGIGLLRSSRQPFKLPVSIFRVVKTVGKRTRMELDELTAGPPCCFDLGTIGRNK